MRDSDVNRMIDSAEQSLRRPIEFDKLRKEFEEQRAAEKTIVDTLLTKGEFLDEDGYPTQDALLIVELWPFDDEKGWFTFIESIWAMKHFGWSEGVARHDYIPDKHVYLYELSTAGWSGNEAIIRAMEENHFLWHQVWVQSRRGGHYQFELDYEEEV